MNKKTIWLNLANQMVGFILSVLIMKQVFFVSLSVFINRNYPNLTLLFIFQEGIYFMIRYFF